MKYEFKKQVKSFVYAFKGLRNVAATQQNFRAHVVTAAIVCIAGFLAHLNASEWCMIVLAIFMVISMETMNTAIEKLVDFISPGHHEHAGIIKDISAAAVLVTAVAAVIVGLIIFLPRII